MTAHTLSLVSGAHRCGAQAARRLPAFRPRPRGRAQLLHSLLGPALARRGGCHLAGVHMANPVRGPRGVEPSSLGQV
eukprot:1196113-Prorocentrum_minimum.AAC.9